MKSLIVTVAVLLTAFGCSTSGSVQSNQQSGQTGVAEQSYAGQITSMNQAGDRIVVNGAEGDKSFVLSSSTVKPNGGLHVNERVTVNYSEIGGRLVASSVGMPKYAYAGQITSMNQAGDRIVVNGAEGDKSFVLSSSTVKPNGGLHVNERVTVNYSEIDGRLVVYAVGMPQPYHVSKELEEHFIREIRRN